MPKNHARSNKLKDLADIIAPVKLKHAELLKLVDDKRCLELLGVIEYFRGEITTHADAEHTLDHDPRFQVLCETCGWSVSMICPECSSGCGCDTYCTGWRHGEYGDSCDEPEDDDFFDDDDEYEDD